jgi:hypothetical protein
LSRIVFATAALSIVAGVGVLAATVGIATITPSRTPAETAASAPPALAAVDPAEEAASASGIRAIPLATGKDAETASVAPKEVEPPLPRARPEEASVTTVGTKSEPEPAKAELRPSTDPVKPDVATLPPPVKSVPTLPPAAPSAPPPVAQVTPASAEAGNTDALISNIEETLAKRDASSAPPPGSLDPHGMEVLPEGEGPVAVLPPPASMAPNYPAPQGSYSSSPAVAGPTYPAGPTYDVVPPAPVTGNGYGNTYPADAYPPPAYPAEAYPSGPVPPADVPYSYPSRPMEYELIPEKRPGLLRRTWMRTADAVTRVFTRDKEDVEPPPQY